MLSSKKVQPGDRFTKAPSGAVVNNGRPVVWVVDRLHDQTPLPPHASLFDLRDRQRKIVVAVNALSNQRYFHPA